MVTGSVSLMHANNANFALDVSSIIITVWGGVTVHGRQSKP